MNKEKIVLESDVISQLQAGKKVTAIKTLRSLRGIGLKEAKELIELYVDQNDLSITKPNKPKTGGGFIALILFGIGCYFLFTQFL